MDENSFLPFDAEEFDDMLVEFKNSTLCSKSEFEATVAAVEFLFPRFKGKLGWSRMCLNGWNVVHVPKHTVPLSECQAFLIAVHICAARYPRLAVGMLLQQKLGLRPSEMLALTSESISMPEHRTNVMREPICSIALGQKTGTNAKREQSVVLRCARVISWLRWALSSTPKGGRVFPNSYDLYRKLFKRVEQTLGITVGWTPHSPRAGFASEAIARGVPFAEVREAGRWRADSSLRTYIDIVAAAQITVDLRVRGFLEAQAYAREHFETFLPGFLAIDHGIHQGVSSWTGRPIVPAVERVGRAAAGGLPSPEGFEAEEIQSGHASSESLGGSAEGDTGRRVHFAPSAVDPPAHSASPSRARGRGRGRA